MAIASRLTNTGTLLVNGSFDEVSYNTTGATGAYVYKNGVSTSTNVLAYSQDWSQYQSLTNATITNNNTVAPDGTQTAGTLTSTITGGTNTALIQKWNPTGISTSVLPWCLSLYVKQGNCPSVGLNLAFYNGSTYQDFIITLTWATLVIATTGSVGTGTTGSGVSYVGDGWYIIYCTITNNYSAPGVVGRMYVRGVAGGNVTGDYNYLWGMQIEQASSPTAYVATGATTSINLNNFAQRVNSSGIEYASGSFDETSYSASGGTGQIGVNGVNTTTNKFTYTQDFSNAIWVKQQLSTSIDVTADAIAAPDGSLTADKLAQSATGGTYYAVYQTFTPIASTNYAYSMFVKNAGGTGSINLTIYDSGNAQNQVAQFNINTGVAGATTITGATFTLNSSSITSYGNGWYRCAFNFSSSTSSSFQFKVDIGVSGVGTGVYLWGAQLEQSLTPTAYVGMLGTGVNLNNFARRDVSTGVEFVYDNFDEVTWNPPIVTSGLALSLDSFNPASYNGTGLTWSDISGNGLIATLRSNPVYPAYTTSNQSFYTNSTNSTISFTVPTSSVLDSTSLTIEIWNQQVNYNNVAAFYGKYYNILSYRENYGVSGYRFGVDGSALTSGKPVFWTDQDAGNFSLQSSISIPVNTWYQTVVTYDSASSTCKIYVNGVLAGTNTSATYNAPTGQLLSLQAYSNGVYSANGYYSVFRQYNTSLSAADVKQNYNALCYRYGLATI